MRSWRRSGREALSSPEPMKPSLYFTGMFLSFLLVAVIGCQSRGVEAGANKTSAPASPELAA